jgi:phosphate ABC transporter phosphate-binding protein
LYDPIGSGGGKQAIKDGTVDFAGSDSSLAEADYVSHPWLQMLPSMASAVVVVVNLPSLDGTGLQVQMDASVIAGIFSGNITRWDDARIKAVNGAEVNVLLPNQTIQVVVRSDKSGTTSLFSSYLASADPTWSTSLGSFSQWPSSLTTLPSFQSEQGNEGAVSRVIVDPYTVTYSSWGFALNLDSEKIALLRNRFGQTVAPGASAVSNAMKTASFDSRFNADIYDQDGSGVWPIAGFTYFIVDTRDLDGSKDCTVHFAKIKMMKWVYESSLSRTVISNMGFVPLPESVAATAVEKLLHLSCGMLFCLCVRLSCLPSFVRSRKLLFP